MASQAPDRIVRFSGTVRLAHWLLASTFFVMLFTGMCLYLPALSRLVGRPTAKAWHVWAAIALGAGIVVLLVVGNRRSLTAVVTEADRLDEDDVEWLKAGPKRLFDHDDAPPQGRLNAGQKLNTMVTLGLMVVLGISGSLLWLGERNTTYRFGGSVLTHDLASLVIAFLVMGHLYLAVLHPATRHALRGIVAGDVDRSWAERNHATWAMSETVQRHERDA
jgi:formate dehydrogenase subunit gamma